MTAAVETETVLYLGRRILVGNKVGYAYTRLADDATPSQLEQAAWYSTKPLLRSATAGTLLQLTRPADDANSYFVKGDHAPTFTGTWSGDRDALLSWQARDRATAEWKRQGDAARRAMKNADVLEPTIQRLVSAAARMSREEREAFATYLAEKVRGR